MTKTQALNDLAQVGAMTRKAMKPLPAEQLPRLTALDNFLAGCTHIRTLLHEGAIDLAGAERRLDDLLRADSRSHERA